MYIRVQTHHKCTCVHYNQYHKWNLPMVDVQCVLYVCTVCTYSMYCVCCVYLCTVCAVCTVCTCLLCVLCVLVYCVYCVYCVCCVYCVYCVCCVYLCTVEILYSDNSIAKHFPYSEIFTIRYLYHPVFSLIQPSYEVQSPY